MTVMILIVLLREGKDEFYPKCFKKRNFSSEAISEVSGQVN